jgi:hypothetical protein
MGVKNQSRSAHRKALTKSGKVPGKVTVVREAVKIPYKPEHVTLQQINAAVRKLETV